MSYSRIQSFKDLIVWQKAMVLVEKVYQIVRMFPDVERYGLCDQLRRASVSIPSNIAEGKQRNSRKEFAHFLGIAHGSIAEVITQIELARRLHYCNQKDYESAMFLLNDISKMNNGLLRSLKSKPNTKDLSP